jgi:Flp pilus assembly protein TadG
VSAELHYSPPQPAQRERDMPMGHWSFPICHIERDRYGIWELTNGPLAYRAGRAEEGSTTVYFLLFTLVMFGLLSMAVDFGRFYLIQAELQTAADAAALAAATRLVGTAPATLHADDQWNASFDSTTGNDNRFNLRINQILISTNLVTSTSVDYFSNLLDAIGNTNGGQTGGIDWSTLAYPKYARVQISAQSPVTFTPLLTQITGSLPTITVAAVAGLTAPLCSASGIDGLAIADQSGGADPDNYGLVPGHFYTLSLTTQTALTDTDQTVPYLILDHFPNGVQGADLDGLLFELAAGGLSTASGLTPPGTVTIDSVEIAYPDGVAALQGSTTTAGADVLCGLNIRFGVDPSQFPNCNVEFADLSALFRPDSDPGTDTYQAGIGLQDFAIEYDGNARRILTVPVVDSADTTTPTVLNFRQFLVVMSPTTTQGVDPTLTTGAFRAQYIGAPVPLRSGGAGGTCMVSNGVGRVVLH